MATNSDVVRQLRVLLELYRLKEEDCIKKVSDIHLQKICSYCTKWRSLYPYLDMKYSDVVSVEHDGYDEEDMRRRFLERWQFQSGHNATYKKLIYALLENECKEEAESVCKLLSASLESSLLLQSSLPLESPLPLQSLSPSAPMSGVSRIPVPTSQPESNLEIRETVHPPHPEIPFGQQFSHVKRGCLAESEKETLLTRLCDDLEKVKMTFASLVSKTLRSLKAHNINFTELKVLITTYVKSKSLTKLLSKKKTLEKIFIAFRDYWSFFDYEILSLIISNFCTELEKEKNEYISAFNEFCKRKVSEVPTNFTSIASGRHYILRVIIKREFDFVTMSELKELEVKLRNITKIDLSLFRSEGGSLVIEFVSLNEEDEMFPLSEKENKELFEMGVLKLYSDSHVYFDYNDYQHSLNTYTSAPHFNQPLQNQHSTSHLVPFDEEWSVDCALKEDKTTSYIPLGSYSHSYPILDSSSPSIDSKHSLKDKSIVDDKDNITMSCPQVRELIMAEIKKENKYQLIKDPIHGSIELHPLLSAIIKTRAFQRLKYLQQLSGLYHVYPGARHTRYEHSIGVGYLAGEFAKQLIAKKRESESEYGADDRKRDEKNILCIQVAGLCHDLGHGPFSHLFDSVIKDHCSIDTETMKKSISHEELSTLILEKIIFEDENVKKKFHKYFTIEGERKIEIKKMMNMIHRSDDFVEGEDLYLYEIVANKATGIDVDKWDYFIRDCHYMGLQHEFDYRRLMQLSRICEKDGQYRICYSEKEVTNILGMFRTRCSLHHKAYKHKKGIAANYLILEAIEEVIDVPLYERGTVSSILNNLKKALEKYLQEESAASTLKLKEGLEGYLDLNDGVIHLIKNAKIPKNGTHKAPLEKALKLLERLDEGSIPHRIPPKEIMDEIIKLKVEAAAEDPGKVEAAAEDPGKVEAAAEDPGKVEAAAEDPGKVEAAPEDPGKVEAAAEDSGKVEAAAEDPGKVEAAAEDPEAAAEDPGKMGAAAESPGKVEAVAEDPGKMEAAAEDPGKVEAAAEDPGKVEAAAEDPEPAFKMLERFLKEKMPSCEKSLSKKASEKWLQSAIDKEINATKALANFFEVNIQEELLLKTAILEVMNGDVKTLRDEIRKESKDEYVFFKEVEFSYGSESKDVNPLDKVLFYFYEELNDGKSERKIMKGSEYKDESLHLFTPRKYYLKEYWWYTSKEPGSKDFDKVKKKIAKRLFKELS